MSDIVFTFSECLRKAKDAGSLELFSKQHPEMNLFCIENKWVDHCKRYIKYRGKYKVEEVLGSAAEFETSFDWRKEHNKMYDIAVKQKWLQFSDIKNLRVVKTDDELIAESRKYDDINVLSQEDQPLFRSIRRRKHLTEICLSHMSEKTLKRNDEKTLAECIESAKNHINVTNWKKEAYIYYRSAYSNEWITTISEQVGWKVRDNSHIKTKILASARQYKYKSDWLLNENNLYAFSKYYGLFKEATAHMVNKPKVQRAKQRKLTRDDCKAIAMNYDSRTAFFKGDPSAYGTSRKKQWIEYVCAHMAKKIFSKEECLASAKNHKHKTEWNKIDPAEVSCAKKSGWYEEIIALAFPIVVLPSFTKKQCIASASRYRIKSDWKVNERNVFVFCRKSGWLDEVIGLVFTNIRTPLSNMNFEQCLASARKYDTKTAWYKGDSRAVRASNALNIYEKCTGHMPVRVGVDETSNEIIEKKRKASALRYNHVNEMDNARW